MPGNVVWFERLAYVSLALALLVVALDFDNVAKAAPAPILVGALLFAIGLTALLIWLIARRRQNWGRWLFLALFVLGLPYFVGNLMRQSLLSVPISLLQAVMQGVALFFIFTGDAKPWFDRPQPVAKPSMPAPQNVERFEQLGYGGLILAIIAAAFELLRLRAGQQEAAAGPVGGVLVGLSGIGAGWLLIWLIARRRMGWARFVFLGLSLLGLAYWILSFGRTSLWLEALGGLQILAWLVAIGFALTDEAQPWFKVTRGLPAGSEKPKARIRVAAGQRIVVEPSEATHRTKVDAHIAEAAQHGIPGYVAAPPLFELLWATGLQIPPPLFLGFGSVMSIAGLPFGIVWIVLNALVARMGVALVLGAWAGLLFGAVIAAYYAQVSRRLALPSWEDYLPLSPSAPKR